MAIVDPSDPRAHLRGKVGGFVYSQQSDGTTTVRSVGTPTDKEPSEPKKASQHRIQLGNSYVHGALRDPALKVAYATEAQKRKMRPCDLMMSDFMTAPVIAGVDATKFTGLAGGLLLVLTGDDFKVILVGVVVRDAADQRLEEGFAVPAQGSRAKTWIYTSSKNLSAGQTLTIEVTASDRAGHSTVQTISYPV
jgi:hypothetical protein